MEESVMITYEDIARAFFMEVITRLHSPNNGDAQREIQVFMDDLFPWVDPDDMSPSSATEFTLFTNLSIDEADDDTIQGSFTPEGKAMFRAWVLKRAVESGVFGV
jgi:hypothetical protein